MIAAQVAISIYSHDGITEDAHRSDLVIEARRHGGSLFTRPQAETLSLEVAIEEETGTGTHVAPVVTVAVPVMVTTAIVVAVAISIVVIVAGGAVVAAVITQIDANRANAVIPRTVRNIPCVAHIGIDDPAIAAEVTVTIRSDNGVTVQTNRRDGAVEASRHGPSGLARVQAERTSLVVAVLVEACTRRLHAMTAALRKHWRHHSQRNNRDSKKSEFHSVAPVILCRNIILAEP
jgi:hypothetical protein